MFYQCSKYGPDFLFGKLKIRDSRDEQQFPRKEKKNYQVLKNEYVVKEY